MPIFRVHKLDNFTSVNNYLIKDKNLTLKEKGMMLVLLSLPDNWEFSVAGLEKICKEAKNTINTILNNLEKYEYLERNKIYENGKIKEWQYDIYEIPKKLYRKNEDIDFQDIEKLDIENCTQLNTNKLITNKLNTNKKRNIYKESFGTYKRVKLTNEEYLRLVNEFGEDFIKQQIEYLDEYVESNNNKNKYTNFNLVLRKAIRENWFSKQKGEDDFLLTMKKEREKYGR